MRENISITPREVKFFIFGAMLFAICEALSIELNNFFNDIQMLRYKLSLNPSVIFFCMCFFIIDLVTELYNDKYANYFIYSKLVSQLAFVGFGIFGVMAAGIKDGQIAQTFFIAPKILINAMIASFVGYKLTGKIMQSLKVKLRGRFLFTRYLSSTFPGELVFSFVFALLTFSQGRSLMETLNIFLGLALIKFILSTVFGLLIIPITNIIRHLLKKEHYNEAIKSIPFKQD